MKKNLSAAIVLSVFLTGSAFAEMPAPAIKGDKPSAKTGMADANRKLGRGLANLTMGWMEIFKGIQEVDRNQNTIAAITWGPVYGLGNAISRTATGAFETLTFPIPTTAEKDYRPILEPEFILPGTNDTYLSDPVTK